MTVRFPWGSLLRGCLGLDDPVAAGIAGLVAPGGVLELLLAPAARDRLDAVPTSEHEVIAGATGAFATLGFDLLVARAATPAEVASTGSSWARRLGVAGRRERAPASNGARVDRSPVLIRLVRR